MCGVSVAVHVFPSPVKSCFWIFVVMILGSSIALLQFSPRFSTLRNIVNFFVFLSVHATDICIKFQEDIEDGLDPILICTDYTLPHLRLYEADCLIHYSLPHQKSNFDFRFSVLLKRLKEAAKNYVSFDPNLFYLKPRNMFCHVRTWAVWNDRQLRFDLIGAGFD